MIAFSKIVVAAAERINRVATGSSKNMNSDTSPPHLISVADTGGYIDTNVGLAVSLAFKTAIGSEMVFVELT